LGATTIWVEQNHVHDKVIHFFLNDDLTGGVIPIVDIGGSMGFAPGLMAFHSNLFNRAKSINLTVLFGSEDDNDATLTFLDHSAFGSPLQLNLLARFYSDSDENYFPGGNRSGADDITSYDIEKGTIEVGISYPLTAQMSWQLHGGMAHGDVNRGDGKKGDDFPRDIAGFGTTRLGAVGSSVTVDFRENWPRTTSGPLINIEYRYHAELSDNRFEFHRYSAEVQQFLRIPFLAQNRRLCLRARLEQREEVGNKEIPFYELSLLGDARNLRGYDQNRFLAKGSLLANVEYRYPIWDTWEAVIFVDQGQVFDAFRDVNLRNFHGSGGVGVRFMTRTGFLFRVEIGFSKEATRALFQLTPNF
jgi:outer membrane protein assembly factor BamA